MSNLYEEIALELARSIDAGVYEPGEKIPGIRFIKESRKVSASTAVAAYRQLELDGYVESRPRSGYYVRERNAVVFDEPSALRELPQRPCLVESQQRVLTLSSQINKPGIIKLGAAVPDARYLPGSLVQRTCAEVLKSEGNKAFIYENPLGAVELRQVLVKRMAQIGCFTRADDMVVTAGCQEAVFLALKAVTQAGDVVALESPTYHGHVQLVEALGLKAVEIPSDSGRGMSVDALQLALDQWPIKACLLTPNFSNPLGSCMSDENKQALVSLAAARDVCLIEDDIYGDLDFSQGRPQPLKAFDKTGHVIYCASFSKTLAPGLRVGWLVSAKYLEHIEYQKIITNVAVSRLPQLAIAKILQSGRYEKHLRFMRVELEKSMTKMRSAIAQYFPEETRMTLPKGGYVLWLELPSAVNSLAIAEQALQQGVSIAPGPMFSAASRYVNYMRVSFAVAWTPAIESALSLLGSLTKAAAKSE